MRAQASSREPWIRRIPSLVSLALSLETAGRIEIPLLVVKVMNFDIVCTSFRVRDLLSLYVTIISDLKFLSIPKVRRVTSNLVLYGICQNSIK